MEHVAHTEELEGVTLKIVNDDSGGIDSPVDTDEAVIFAVLHRRYENPADKRAVHKANGECYDFSSVEGIREFEADNAAPDSTWAVFGLYMYDHSGTSYRAAELATGNPFMGHLPQGHAEFDSGRVGIIALKRADVGTPGTPYGNGAGVVGTFLEQANQVCECYTDWANGNVWGYVIEDEEGEHLDSCWGFIGDSDEKYLMEQAREALAYQVKPEIKAARLLALSTKHRARADELAAQAGAAFIPKGR